MRDEAPPPPAGRSLRQLRGHRDDRLRPGHLRLHHLRHGLLGGPGPAVRLRPDHPAGASGRRPGRPLRSQAHDGDRGRRFSTRTGRRHGRPERLRAPTRPHPGGRGGLVLPGGADRARIARLRDRPGRRGRLRPQRGTAPGGLLRPVPPVPTAGRPPPAPGGTARTAGPGRLHLPGHRGLLDRRHASRGAS